MRTTTAAAALGAALPLALAQTQSNETVLGVYMFHRSEGIARRLDPTT